MSTKMCPIHPNGPTELALEEFGTCRARPDGKNLYCKSCIRAKIAAQRLTHKAWKNQQEENELRNTDSGLLPARKPPVLAKRRADIPRVDGLSFWASVVLWAMDRGAHTQRQMMVCMRSISRANDLEDTLGEALAELFYHRLLSTIGEVEDRKYFRRRVA